MTGYAEKNWILDILPWTCEVADGMLGACGRLDMMFISAGIFAARVSFSVLRVIFSLTKGSLLIRRFENGSCRDILRNQIQVSEVSPLKTNKRFPDLCI